MPSKLTGVDKSFLLSLARRAISSYFETGKRLEPTQKEIPSPNVLEQGACFVTLHLHGELRGCIGSLVAHRPLLNDVIENALASAFEDTRFDPLTKEELKLVKISISYLTPPKPFPVKDSGDLLAKLIPHKHGLILQKGMARATFLPAVWEELPKKEDFLSHLCMKAGLSPVEWKNTKGMIFQVYEADEFGEE